MLLPTAEILREKCSEVSAGTHRIDEFVRSWQAFHDRLTRRETAETKQPKEEFMTDYNSIPRVSEDEAMETIPAARAGNIDSPKYDLGKAERNDTLAGEEKPLISNGMTPQEAISQLLGTDITQSNVKVFIYAGDIKPYGEHVDVVARKDRATKKVRFIQKTVERHADSADTALIEFPEGFVEALGLQNFVLDQDEIDRRMKTVEIFNKPRLAPAPPYKSVRIGNVRI